MNKTKVTKRKGSKTKTDNGSAEVFVLPPNLLERLGINLENIGSASEITTESQVTDLNIISKEKDASENKLTPKTDFKTCVTTSSKIESSIVETAKLMKKSVFLSPTFISPNTSVIQGEIEIAGNVVEPEDLQDEVAVSLMSNEFSDKKIAEVSLDMQIEYESDVNVYKQNCSPFELSTQESKQCDQTVNGNVSTLHDTEMQTVFDDHADEAYSSDGSNSNIGCAANTGFNKSNKNKINIISEQIIDPSQFYKLKNKYSSPEHTFIHVPINTMITSHNINSSYHENVPNMDLNIKSTTIAKPIEITVANECNMHDQNCVKEHIISTVECDMLQNINTFDTSSVLKEVSSEFLIVTQNQEEPQQDTDIAAMFLKQDVDGNKDNSFVSKIISHETKFELVPENESPSAVYSVEVDNCNMKNNMRSTAHQRGWQNMKESETIVQKNGNPQYSEPDFINQENDTTLKQKKEANRSATKDPSVSRSIDDFQNLSKSAVEIQRKIDNNNAKSSNTNQNNRDKNKRKVHPVIEVKGLTVIDTDVDGNKDNSFVSKIMSHETKSELVDSSIPTSCVNEPENESPPAVYSVEDENCNMKNNMRSTAHQGGLQNMKESETIVQKNGNPQISEPDFINQENDKTLKQKKEADQSATKDLSVSRSVDDFQNLSKSAVEIQRKIDNNNAKSSHTNQNNRDKNKRKVHPVIEVKGLTVIDTDVDGNKDNSFVSKIMSHEPKSELVDNSTATSYVNEPENESPTAVYSVEDENCNMKNNMHSTANQGGLQNMKKSETIVQKNGNPQNSEPDFINQENDKTLKQKKEANQSATKDLPESRSDDYQNLSKSAVEIQSKIDINNAKSSHSNQYSRDKNKRKVHPVIEASTESHNCKKQGSGRNYTKRKQKDIPEYSDVKREVKLNSNESCYENNYVDNAHKSPVIEEDRVREIAKYLSKFADMQKRNQFKERHGSVSSTTLSNKKHITNSKSSIQGVEKPGGSVNKQIRNGPPIHTYGRTLQERCKTIPAFVQSMCADSHMHAQSIDVTDFGNVSKEMELCLCDDFGRLTSYDNEDIYEHIHFSNNAKSDGTPDIIFSIYNEDDRTVTIDKYAESKEEYSSETTSIPERKLCWHEIKLTHENKFDDFDNDCNNKGKESIENYTHERRKYIPPKADLENIAKDKCNKRQKTEKEPVYTIKRAANLIQNSEETPSNKVATDEHTTKLRKKRKFSIKPDDKDDPPAKKYGSLFQQLPRTEQGRDVINQDQSTTNIKKTRRIEKKPAEGPSTSLVETTIKFVEQTWSVRQPSASLNKATATEKQSAIPVNDANINAIERPSEPENETTANPDNQSSTVLNKGQLTLPVKAVTEYRSTVCGVCRQNVEDADWVKHIATQHNYLAWKCGEPSLDVDDENAVRNHLSYIAKLNGGLECAKCGLVKKYAKGYLSHVKCCSGLNEGSSEVISEVESEGHSVKKEVTQVNEEFVKCGVCEKSIQNTDWSDHIASRHDYLAWKLGEPSLDVNDEIAVREHLYEITKASGGLTCAKCGLTRKYVKAYLSHIRRCSGLNESQNDSTYNVSSEIIPKVESESLNSNAVIENDAALADTNLIKCGVCEESVEMEDWSNHIGSRHDYLAWKDGDSPLDVNDEAAVRGHLYELTKQNGGLTCAKCGLVRKYVKAYLSHIRSCNGLNESQNDSTYNISSVVAPGVELDGIVYDSISNIKVANEEVASNVLFACGVCEESIQEENWNIHIGSRHDYLAWKLGEPALDVNDETAVKEHLYELTKKYGGLTCAKCGLTRKYVKAYLNHIKKCNGLNESQNDSACNVSGEHGSRVKCAVCADDLLEDDWNDHRASKHNYLAWKCGEQCLDIADDVAIWHHLYSITTAGGLRCATSDITDEYVKSYVDHIKFSHGPSATTTVSAADLVKCGVCGQYMVKDDWHSHLAKNHEYLAWKDGEPPFNVDDKEEMRVHLQNLIKEIGGLSCPKCGLQRKYAKSYLHHIRTCDGFQEGANDDDRPAELNNSEIEGTSSNKCGMCNQVIEENSLWIKHLSEEHNYLAWKDGDTPLDLDDAEQVYQHLYNLSKELGGLICKYCGKIRKYVKSYLEHVKNCNKSQNDGDESRVHLQNLAKKIGGLCCPKCGLQRKYVKSYLSHLCSCGDDQNEIDESIKCGACNQVVNSSFWAKHLFEAHDYMAWKDGDTPPDLYDQEQVNQHLYDLSKEFGGLTCKYCGITRKYVKSYLEHIKCCKDNSMTEESEVGGANNSTLDLDDSVVDFASGGICAVCQKEVTAGKWIQHTQKEHNYLAWREGENPWDIEDFADVNQYLYVICKRMGGLTCNKCGIVRKYVKSYLSHIKTCNVTDFNLDSSVSEGIGPVNKDIYQCAMCKEHIKPKDWNTHAMKKHYNVTWIIGQTPIDIKNPYAVEKYLKDYKQVSGILKCNVCSTTRASFSGFYAHIITCGKSEEEIDMFRSVCEICNNKYLCIYKNQHAMIHRVQSYNAELKTKKIAETKEEVSLSGKRRAAVKARSVIEKYSDNMSKHAHTCQSCGYGTDFKEELETHNCGVSNGKDFSGDESSAAELGSSDDESPDSDVDSNISNEVNDGVEAEEDDDNEPQPKKRIRFREYASALSKVMRIPFKVEDPNSYIIQGDEDFCKTHLTDEVLYPRWYSEHEAVVEQELPRYLPPLEHSCKVKLGSDDWITLKRFGAKRDTTATTIFVGASIVCISWAPLRVEEIDNGHNFLAIACHNGADCPRYQGDETPSHENLIQIWNYAATKELPKLAFGIAHDFGTVWSMDWCPSGARDALPEDPVTCRLGLLAVACSSGSAYIFSVPYPSTVVNNEFVYKLKPVAELRMTMCSERKRYQATSVSWSKQKGHTIILVGYADGSTAFYDLHTKSPLLCMMENNVEIFHPYHDERPHNTCITGTDLYPVSSDDATGCGAGAWVAPTGAQLATRAGAAGASGRARLHVASLGVEFAPHAGSAVLAGDDAIMHTAISELVWVPPGRRLGPIRSLAGCARCGRVVASMPPTLRVMRPHPAYYDLKKQIVGMLEMTHLAKKRKKQVNDELAMTIEPLTYADAVSKYGLEFKTVSRSDRVMQHQCAAKPKAHCPERFPLADVKSMAFCPSRKLHEKLAVATHAGILFLMTLK